MSFHSSSLRPDEAQHQQTAGESAVDAGEAEASHHAKRSDASQDEDQQVGLLFVRRSASWSALDQSQEQGSLICLVQWTRCSGLPLT